MTHKEFLDKGRPACMGHLPEKPDHKKDNDEPGLACSIMRNEARRIAANIAKQPDLLKKP